LVQQGHQTARASEDFSVFRLRASTMRRCDLFERLHQGRVNAADSQSGLRKFPEMIPLWMKVPSAPSLELAKLADRPSVIPHYLSSG
jgi:hypothetical protein